MKFLTKITVLSLFAFGATAGFAADSTNGRVRGSVTGAIVSANTGRMIAMPIAPGVNTSVNTVSNVPNIAVTVEPQPPTEVDFCKAPYFNKDKCCAGPNPPAYICNPGPIDYCRAPNFDYQKCCSGVNPPAEICGEPVIDYCRAPNFDREKCCSGPNPDPVICEAVDFCRGTYFDKEKCCALPNPPVEICGVDPCGEVIPALGVDKCVAEQACASIRADGMTGIFDLDSLQCLIPVCAHNWGGIIRAGGENVCAYIPMGNIFKCDASAFEQIRYMRRTSQWVVPVMVVGGAGIGAGVGAIVDHYDNKKAEKFKEEAAANAYDGHNAELNGKPLFTSTGGSIQVDYNGRTYVLDNPSDRADLINALGLQPRVTVKSPVDDLIRDADARLNSCVKKMFHDLVSPTAEGIGKFGRIKTTSSGPCDTAATDNIVYCQFDGGCSGCDPNENVKCKTATKRGAGEGTGGFPTNGICYYRDGIGSVSSQATADNTASDDLYRATILFGDKSDTLKGANISNMNILANAGCRLHTATYNGARGQKALRYLTVTCNQKFGDLNLVGDENSCNDATLVNTRDRLWATYGALGALKAYSETKPSVTAELDTAKLNDMLSKIVVAGDAVVATTDEFNLRVDEEFGKKRPFFQTGVGRGLLIGTGVGTLGGLGYYFAEGASTFCNVGGLDQTKMNKYFSIPSFREYIVRYGFVK